VPLPWWKRTLDVVLSGLAMLVLLPFFVVVAIAIRLDTPGPIFFTQKRAGRGAMPFALYKFRSMIVGAERLQPSLRPLNEQSGPVFKIRHDPRITRVGRWLRRWSLDELPQLWNVFKGDISLVGPRSPTFEEVSEYERWQRRRLDVQGGITCIWQVSGRSEIGFREWMRMDMAYVSRRSFWLDVELMLRTIWAIVTGRGAY
jgi:lipopolysaccharide/colanic/teichoic acid biosynthesis glycosyltransferase